MSRSSAKTLRVALAPAEIALAVARNAAVSRPVANPEAGAPALLATLDEALSEPAFRSRDIEIVVSQHFVRHVVTAAPGKALSRSEEVALVASTFESIYGDVTSGWRMLAQSQPPSFGLVGAAIDASFVAQLEQILARHRFAELRILPFATVASARLPSAFSGWWALVEPGWLTLFEGTRNAWRKFVDQPVGADWTVRVADLIFGEAEPDTRATPVWLQPAGVGSLDVPSSSGPIDWKVLPYRPELHGASALLDY